MAVVQARADTVDVQLATDGVDDQEAHEARTAEGDSSGVDDDDDDSELPIRRRVEDEQYEDGQQEAEGHSHTDDEPSEAGDSQRPTHPTSGGKRSPAVEGGIGGGAASESRAKRRKRAVDIASLPLAAQEAITLEVLRSEV